MKEADESGAKAAALKVVEDFRSFIEFVAEKIAATA